MLRRSDPVPLRIAQQPLAILRRDSAVIRYGCRIQWTRSGGQIVALGITEIEWGDGVVFHYAVQNDAQNCWHRYRVGFLRSEGVSPGS